MKIKHIFKLSYSNIKLNKANSIMTIAIITLCMTAYVVINCVSVCVTGFKTNLVETKRCRTIMVTGENINQSDLRSIEHVTAVQEDSSSIGLNIESPKLKYSEKVKHDEQHYIVLHSYYDNVIPQVIKGENIKPGMKNVGIIPNYFQTDINFDASTKFKQSTPYLKGEDFIGEKMTSSYSKSKDITKPFSEANSIEHKYEFTVIGVYDLHENNSNFGSVYIPVDDLKGIYKDLNPKGWNIQIVSLVVDESENLPAVYGDLSEMGYRFELKSDPSSMVETASKFVVIAMTVSYVALFFLIISISVLMASTIQKRKIQIAILKTVGYQKQHITLSLLLEGLILCFVAVLLCIVITLILLFVLWTPIINNLMAIVFVFLKVDFMGYLKYIGIGTVGCFLSSLIGIYLSSAKAYEIESAVALKE